MAGASRHEALTSDGARRIAVSGSSGLVGTRLCAILRERGHTVLRLVRRPPSSADEIFWDPEAGRVDVAGLQGCDAVVHLAGENIAAGRWTADRKRRILESRVQGTRVLAEALASLRHPPSALLSASAIGYYGDRGSDPLDERSEHGAGFLCDVTHAWEAATTPAARARIRVVNLRIGVALASQGGALAKMLTPFRLGVGGVVGSGRQYMSWIALDDLVGAIHFALFTQTVRGPVNATAPRPVTNYEFAKTLGRVLRRPALVPLPSPMVRLRFGEMGEALLLGGARVVPATLQKEGFEFLYPELEGALRAEIFGRPG